MKKILIVTDDNLNIISLDQPKISLGDTVTLEITAPIDNSLALRVDFELPVEAEYLRPATLFDTNTWQYLVPNIVLQAVSSTNTAVTLPTFITAVNVINNTINEAEGFINKVGNFNIPADLPLIADNNIDYAVVAFEADTVTVNENIWQYKDNVWTDSGLKEKLDTFATAEASISIDKFAQNTQELVDTTVTDLILDNLAVNNASLLNVTQNVYASGIVEFLGFTDNLDGSIDLPEIQANLWNVADPVASSILKRFTVPAVTGMTLVDQKTNYVYVDYNNGVPEFRFTTNVELINFFSAKPYLTIFRDNTEMELHDIDWDSDGMAQAEKILLRLIKTDRFIRESGLIISTDDPNRTVQITQGIVWNGVNRQTLMPFNSLTDDLRLYAHVSGTFNLFKEATFRNDVYDDGTDLVTLTAGRYAVIWVFRGIEMNPHGFAVMGVGDYTLGEAQNAQVPAIPEIMANHTELVGKIIILKDSDTPISVESAFDLKFTSAGTQDHRDLTNKDATDQHPISSVTGLTDALLGYDSTNFSGDTKLAYNATGDFIVKDSVDATILEIREDLIISNQPINMTNKKIISLAEGTNPNDAVVRVQLDLKADQATTYNKTEVDNAILASEQAQERKEPVATFADLATTYPTPEIGWLSFVIDQGRDYVWDGSIWTLVHADIPLATAINDGLMSQEDKAQLDLNTPAISSLQLNKEDIVNKTDNIQTNILSSIKYPSTKGVSDFIIPRDNQLIELQRFSITVQNGLIFQRTSDEPTLYDGRLETFEVPDPLTITPGNLLYSIDGGTTTSLLTNGFGDPIDLTTTPFTGGRCVTMCYKLDADRWQVISTDEDFIRLAGIGWNGETIKENSDENDVQDVRLDAVELALTQKGELVSRIIDITAPLIGLVVGAETKLTFGTETKASNDLTVMQPGVDNDTELLNDNLQGYQANTKFEILNDGAPNSTFEITFRLYEEVGMTTLLDTITVSVTGVGVSADRSSVIDIFPSVPTTAVVSYEVLQGAGDITLANLNIKSNFTIGGDATPSTTETTTLSDPSTETPAGAKTTQQDANREFTILLDGLEADKLDKDLSGLTEKVSPISTDVLYINDSEDSNNPKKIQIANLPASGAYEIIASGTVINPIAGDILIDESLLPNGSYQLILSEAVLNTTMYLAFKRVSDSMLETISYRLYTDGTSNTVAAGLFVFNDDSSTANMYGRTFNIETRNRSISMTHEINTNVATAQPFKGTLTSGNVLSRRHIIVNANITGSFNYKLVKLN